jgi:hypothetical protein
MRRKEMKYEIKDEDLARVGKDFSYHPPKDDQPARYVEIRDTAAAVALGLMQNCPPSRERSLALTALEECVMWANASIARNE